MKANVWYWKGEYMKDMLMGWAWMEEHSGRMTERTIKTKTHVQLTTIEVPEGVQHSTISVLEYLFLAMQGENWSPNGEASELIRSKDLTHTSMSVGDVVEVGSKLYAVDLVGWVDVASGAIVG